MNDSERRIPVRYAKRGVGGRCTAASRAISEEIKVAMSGVMPIIFATILSIPSTINLFVSPRPHLSGKGSWMHCPSGWLDLFHTLFPS